METEKMTEETYSLYQRKNGYWYYWTYDIYGKKYQKSTGTKIKAKAKIIAAQRLKEGRLIEVKKRLPYNLFEEFARDFFIYDRCPYIQTRLARGYNYSKKQAKSNRYYLENYILPYFRGRLMESITIGDINHWLIRLPGEADITNKTANNILTILRQILMVAVEEAVISVNPATSVRPLAKNKNSKRTVAFTQEQIRLLFSSPWKSNIAEYACKLAAYTGMRSGEIRALWQEQLHGTYIEVDASYNNHDDGRKCTKSGYSRFVPITEEINQLIEKINSRGLYVFSFDGEHPVANSYFQRCLKKRMDECGIRPKKGTRLTFHSFRHYMNSRLIAAGMQGEKIRAVIGHEDEDMTEHYAHLEVEDLSLVREVQKMAI